MRASLLGFLFLLIPMASFAQDYPDWESIDNRDTPQWWTDAKFGIFIHWGPYSVPAFSKVGEYSEWYWRELVDDERRAHTAVKTFHDRVYGSGFTYPDFVPQFKAELFNPTQWAEIFEQSGAKYVVLTSKHHDGFALWPSAEADRSWGRPWNSVATGPQRDLVGDLTEAVRQTDVKMGLYFSLYEWFNPLYVSAPDLYVDQHMIPQFKDVVSRYAPDVIFSDGEWEHPAATWRSKEMLQWLLTDGPNPNTVVINDRWGKETRHAHGGYYTTEYGSGLPNAAHPWEETRGMAHSFGFSRTENLSDYESSQKLLFMLVDIVARGGNFLLDIGPTADGRIPVIMQERLLDLGRWLEVNGEAIYGTTTWLRSNQWSDGQVPEEKRGQYMSGYNIMKLTVAPDPGFAVKEILFTQKGEQLYAICPRLPDDELIIRDLIIPSDATIDLLGIETELEWHQVGDAVVVSIPAINPSDTPYPAAWTFRISRWR